MSRLRLLIIDIVICLLLSCSEEPSLKEVYSLIANGSAPQSFQLIMYDDASLGIDSTIWIKFSVDSLGFDNIISQGRYKEAKPQKWDGMYPPNWWVPEQLGESRQYYESQVLNSITGFPRIVKALWVNRSLKCKTAMFVYATF